MRKKIVLYNTTIDALLKYNEKAIKKMEYVFRFFTKKNDLVLIWRPHPLLEATLRSIRPGLLDSYLELVAYYKNNNIGILDESSDLDRAIVISDAYYGDWSSVADLYKVTGKPILIQDIEVMEKDILPVKWAFSSSALQIYQDRIYAIARKGDVLLSKGKQDKLSVIKHLIGGSTQENLYNMSITHEGKIYFAPWKADSFLCYDIVSGKAKKIPMEESLGNERFYLVKNGKDILAIGINSMKVYSYDSVKNWFRCILPGCEEKELYAFKRVKVHDYIPFVDKKTNELCIYAISENKWNVYPFQKGVIQDLMYDGEWCWIITKTGDLIKSDASTGAYFGEKVVSVDLRTMFMFDGGKEVLLLPEKGIECIHVEKNTMQSTKEVLNILKDGLRHCFSEITYDQILVESYEKTRKWYLWPKESFCVYNYLKNMVTWKELCDGDESCRQELRELYDAEYRNSARKKERFFVEEANRSLDYLCYLLYEEEEEFDDAQFEPFQSNGERIHEIIMQNMYKDKEPSYDAK